MFNLGDLVLIELALVRDAKDLDLSMQVGQQYMEIIGKCEKQIQTLRAAALNAGSGPALKDPASQGD